MAIVNVHAASSFSLRDSAVQTVGLTSQPVRNLKMFYVTGILEMVFKVVLSSQNVQIIDGAAVWCRTLHGSLFSTLWPCSGLGNSTAESIVIAHNHSHGVAFW